MMRDNVPIRCKYQVCAVKRAAESLPLGYPNAYIRLGLACSLSNTIRFRPRNQESIVVIPLPVFPAGFFTRPYGKTESQSVWIAWNVGFRKNNELCAGCAGFQNLLCRFPYCSLFVKKDRRSLNQSNFQRRRKILHSIVLHQIPTIYN